jgi:SAM-dependent methyltransferase
MPEYALLVSPSANRVYADAAAGLARAELALVGERVLGGALGDLRVERMGSVDYLMFAAGEELPVRALAALSNLSSTFALFAREDGRLRPLELRRLDRFDSDLLTIQRYAGKTNESFTKLLLVVTLASSAFAPELGERTFSVLDPLCGRGTTLNQALMLGFHAAGVELDRRDFEAYASFVQRWVKDKRLVHRAQVGHVKGHPRLALDIGLDRQSFKDGKALHLSVVNASTLETTAVYPPRSFDLVVADAPYGIQHGSTAARGELSRSPLDLVTEAAPVWREALRPGGALGLAWNTHVAPRGRVLEALARAGLEVCDGPAYRAFEHRVDQAILRDVVVARKPARS